MGEKLVVLLDPYAGSANVGDRIIRDAVLDILDAAYAHRARIVSISVHQKTARHQRRLVQRADLVVAGGSNLLNFRYIPFHDDRWNLALADFLAYRNVLLLGVGWSSYRRRDNAPGRWLYGRILSRSLMHSVRDGHTRDLLGRLGFANAVNTACPSMWALTPAHMAGIAPGKGRDAVVTLTDYDRAPEIDRAFLAACVARYRRVHFWPQGAQDLDYVRTLDVAGLAVLAPSLEAYDRLLSGEDSLDYVGTRLHAGIRALQKGRRAIVLAIDNRAAEISADTGLPVIPRAAPDAMERLAAAIEGEMRYDLALPWDAIMRWRAQLPV